MGFVSVNPIVLLLHLKTSSHTYLGGGGGRGEGEGKKLCSLEGTHGHSVCFYCFASPLCTNVARYMTPDWWAGTRRLLTSGLGQVDS